MKPYVNQIILLVLVIFFGIGVALNVPGSSYAFASCFAVLLGFLDPRGASAQAAPTFPPSTDTPSKPAA